MGGLGQSGCEQGLWIQTALDEIPGPLPTSCDTSGNLSKFSEPEFPQLLNVDHNSPYFTELL